MNAVFYIFACLIMLGSCAKPKTKDPVPHIDFLDFRDPRRSTFTGSDTATMVLAYEDGDGDLFVDNFSEGPNMIFTTYRLESTGGSFVADTYPGTQDTIRYGTTIKQPDNGYYKGKSIRGEIYIPLSSFRQSNEHRVIKFSGFLTDEKGHKSNIFTSPVYTLNF